METTRWVPPPGFRFHPTEEELVGYYLNRKINSRIKVDFDFIVDVDLYNMEPWDIKGQCSRQACDDEERNEWFFFSHKDKKYPSGTRTNRATSAGFWKATGRDKAVVSNNKTIGMRKTLVFYNGRAPNGRKTDWIIHEYKLISSSSTPREDGWVVCRAFKKASPVINIHHHKQQGFEDWVQTYNNEFGTSSQQSFPELIAASTPFDDGFAHQDECSHDQLFGATAQGSWSHNFDEDQAGSTSLSSYTAAADLTTSEGLDIPSMGNLGFQAQAMDEMSTIFSYEPNNPFYQL